MHINFIFWHQDDDPEGNVLYIAEHGLTKEDVEDVLLDPVDTDVSRSSRRPIAFGFTRHGRYFAVVYEIVDEITVYPVTAFVVDDE